jgi:hypothetical protein
MLWFESWLLSQAYWIFRERLRSRGKVRHLRGLRGGIPSLFRAEVALRRFLATFREMRVPGRRTSGIVGALSNRRLLHRTRLLIDFLTRNLRGDGT